MLLRISYLKGMKEKSLKQQEEELFAKWKVDYPGFSPDGIVNEAAYLQSQPRIMLVMKETNSKDGSGVELCAFLENGGRSDKNDAPRKPTWDNVARWVHGIRNLDEDFNWKYLNDKVRKKIDTWRNTYLPQLCVMNVKKSAGTHTANAYELAAAAEFDKDYLKRQYEIYAQSSVGRPDLIIVCGTDACVAFNNQLGLVTDKNPWVETSRGLFYSKLENGSVIIWYSHPAARVDDALLYYGLVDGVREIMKPHHHTSL